MFLLSCRRSAGIKWISIRILSSDCSSHKDHLYCRSLKAAFKIRWKENALAVLCINEKSISSTSSVPKYARQNSEQMVGFISSTVQLTSEKSEMKSDQMCPNSPETLLFFSWSPLAAVLISLMNTLSSTNLFFTDKNKLNKVRYDDEGYGEI